MIKRTLFFSTPCSLKTKDKQLIIENRETGELEQAPIEDLGFVVFDNILNPSFKSNHNA